MRRRTSAIPTVIYPTGFLYVAARDIFGSVWLAARVAAPYQQVPEWEGGRRKLRASATGDAWSKTSRKRLGGKRLEWERDGSLYAIQSTATKQRAAV